MSYLENTFKWEWVLHEDLIKASSLSGEDMNILSKIKEDFQKEMSKASGDTTQYKSEISVSTTDLRPYPTVLLQSYLHLMLTRKGSSQVPTQN